MDKIFKALNDPTRRKLLDALRTKDGQTLTELETQLTMSRFGVMKHLNVLEEASLILTRKQGRFKYHYLNALPLQEVIDRWIEPLLAKPAARGLIDLKAKLEGDTTMTQKPDFVMQTYIRCTQDALWDALTDPAQMSQYHFLSTRVERKGDMIQYYRPDGDLMLKCRETVLTPKSRIDTTFELLGEGMGAPSRTVYLIEPQDGFCSLTLEHYDLTFPVVAGEGVADGWARWAAGLKTWLETGEEVRFSTQIEVPA